MPQRCGKTAGRLRHRGLWRRLLQHAEVRAKVDVIGGTVDDEGGHGLDSGGPGFVDAALGGAEGGELDIEAARGESGGDVLLGGDAGGSGGGIGAAALCGGGGQGSALILRVPA